MHKVYSMKFNKIYDLLLNKVVRKQRTKEELDAIIHWFTGCDIDEVLSKEYTYEEFFKYAPRLNKNRELIHGTICKVKIDEIEDPLMKDIRRLDKLVDELAKGKKLEKILREGE